MTTRAAVAELEAQDRLDEAAELAETLDDHQQAARLWERACRFDRAALSALAAGDAAKLAQESGVRLSAGHDADVLVFDLAP